MLLHCTPNSYTLGELLKEEGSQTKGLTSPVVQEKNWFNNKFTLTIRERYEEYGEMS
jgi:hypothetical protein